MCALDKEKELLFNCCTFVCFHFSYSQLDLYPEDLRSKIEEVNPWIYDNINNGVYKCGFATTQEAYERAFDNLFTHLDKVEAILSQSRYLTGNRLTLADIRLFTTLLRFDAVYYGHFKTNLRVSLFFFFFFFSFSVGMPLFCPGLTPFPSCHAETC